MTIEKKVQYKNELTHQVRSEVNNWLIARFDIYGLRRFILFCRYIDGDGSLSTLGEECGITSSRVMALVNGGEQLYEGFLKYKSLDSQAIDMLCLSSYAESMMRRNGIWTINDLEEVLSSEEGLLSLHGVGGKIASEVYLKYKEYQKGVSI